jgi:hypothetical protein
MMIPSHHITESIGYATVAKVSTSEAQSVGNPCQAMRLWIMTASMTDEGAHSPAESIEIYSLAHITALRDFLTKAIAIAHKGASAEPVVEAVNQAAIEKTP